MSYVLVHIYIFPAHQHRKLTFVYLANDIIQNSKKKGPEFAKLFAKILPEAFSNAARYACSKHFAVLSDHNYMVQCSQCVCIIIL